MRLADPSGDWATLRVLPGGEGLALAWGHRRSTLAAYRAHLSPGEGPEPDRGLAYERALESLDIGVATITRRRLDQAHARIDRGDRPKLAEFDLINGLTGLGAHLLRRDPNGALIGRFWRILSGSPNPSVLRIFPAGTGTAAWRTASAAPWRCCPSR